MPRKTSPGAQSERSDEKGLLKTNDLPDKSALNVSAESDRSGRDNAYQMLGAARYAEYIHAQTKSDIIRFGIAVRDNKTYLEYGFANFDDWLESDMCPLSRATFRRELELFLAEGDQYELFNVLRIPAAQRRQLTSGDVTIDGDHALIGDQRIPLNDGIGVKKLVERLVKDKISAEKDLAKADKDIVRLKGVEEQLKQLKAEIKERDERPEFVTAYLATVEALLTFIAEVDDLPGELKAERAAGDLEHIIGLLDQLYRAYGESFPFKTKAAKPAGRS